MANVPFKQHDVLVGDATPLDCKGIPPGTAGNLLSSDGTDWQSLPPASPTGVIKADGTVPFAADESMGSHKLTNVTDPSAAQDAATKHYVDIGDAAAQAASLPVASTLNAIATANPTSADVNINSHKLTNVTDPSAAQDAATKSYVDAHGGDTLASYILIEDFLGGGIGNTESFGRGVFDLYADNNGGGSFGGNVGYIDANHPGILQQFVAAVSDIAWAISNGGCFTVGGFAQKFETMIRLPALSNGTDRFTFNFGIGDNNDLPIDQNHAIEFRYSDNVNGGKFQAACVTANGSLSTIVDTGIAPTANTWIKLAIAINANGTSVDFLINDVVVATITTHIPIPAPAGDYLGWSLAMRKTVGTATVFLYTDYLMYQPSGIVR